MAGCLQFHPAIVAFDIPTAHVILCKRHGLYHANNDRVDGAMKYLLILLLAGLAGVEYVHHLSDPHALSAMSCITPPAKLDNARDLLRQHLHNH
jgi:hypothetical protein